MTIVSTHTRPFPLSLGVPGWARDAASAVSRFSGTPEFKVLCAVLAALGLWGVAIVTFGYPALILTALGLVPTMFTVLVLITVGR